jgi:hypothetical protein
VAVVDLVRVVASGSGVPMIFQNEKILTPTTTTKSKIYISYSRHRSIMVLSSLLKASSGKNHRAATVGLLSACGIFYSSSSTEKTWAEASKEANKNSMNEKDEELFEVRTVDCGLV